MELLRSVKTLDFELVSCVSDLQTIIVSQFEHVVYRFVIDTLFQRRPSQVIPDLSVIILYVV